MKSKLKKLAKNVVRALFVSLLVAASFWLHVLGHGPEDLESWEMWDATFEMFELLGESRIANVAVTFTLIVGVLLTFSVWALVVCLVGLFRDLLNFWRAR